MVTRKIKGDIYLLLLNMTPKTSHCSVPHNEQKKKKAIFKGEELCALIQYQFPNTRIGIEDEIKVSRIHVE